MLFRSLQIMNPGKPFYLSCRVAARLLGTDHVTASRWLRQLVAYGFLRETSKGSSVEGKASEFMYLLELKPAMADVPF